LPVQDISRKNKYDVKKIDKETMLSMVQKYHYSNTLPKINKHFIGFYFNNVLVGCVSLGWGTRPLHTIKRIFPSLRTIDYLEIGRMCMSDDMPRNSESKMLSQLVKWTKTNLPCVKILFTWADGMLGKVGYVYQASNFTYAGYSEGEFYLKNGVKIHVRQMKSFLVDDYKKEQRISVRPNYQQMLELGIEHYKGKQFRYLYFLCRKKEKKQLLVECLIDLSLPNPKKDSLNWKKKVGKGLWVETHQPEYKTDTKSKQKNKEQMEFEFQNGGFF
jgi:hypothetical protein